MASKYLDSNGLALVWEKIKNALSNKVDKENGKGLSTNDYTAEEKAKLANIAAGAEVNVNADWDAVTGDAAILHKPSIPTATSDLTNDSGFITVNDVPEGAAASTTVPLMDGTAATGTETAFARGDHVHPSDTTKVDKVAGKGLSTNDYTTAEKNKLSAIEAGANNYTLPTASANVLGGVKVGANLSITDGVLSADAQAVDDATTTSSGLMSAEDKVKLNGIAAGADDNVIEAITVNNAATTVSNKTVNITVPTNNNQLTNGAGFIKDQYIGYFRNQCLYIPKSFDYSVSEAGNYTYTFPFFLVSSNSVQIDSNMYFREIESTTNLFKFGAILMDGVSQSTAVLEPKNLYMCRHNDGVTSITTITSLSDVKALGYQTASDVSSAIASAIGDLEGVEFSIVQNLPVTGDSGVIYLIADTHSDSNDSYDEYIWLSDISAYEKIGNTDVNLSDYYNTTNLVAITSAEINAICTLRNDSFE